ncbi:hypothetical protein NFI96_009362, partial [Prochilodus magdalenae]
AATPCPVGATALRLTAPSEDYLTSSYSLPHNAHCYRNYNNDDNKILCFADTKNIWVGDEGLGIAVVQTSAETGLSSLLHLSHEVTSPLETDPIEDELERAWPPFNSSVDIQRENRRSCGLFVSVRGDVAGELELDNTDLSQPLYHMYMLQDCFGCTDWQVFREASESEGELVLEDYTSAVIGYIRIQGACGGELTASQTIKPEMHNVQKDPSPPQALNKFYSRFEDPDTHPLHKTHPSTRRSTPQCDTSRSKEDPFNVSLTQAAVPTCLKTTIIPVPMSSTVTGRTDPQMTSSVVHTALTHLEQKDSYVRMLFVDFTTGTGYLGVHLSNNLTWSNNTSSLVRKAHQRLYFLRRLRRAGLGSSVLTSFYRCMVKSVLCSSINVWHGSCSAADRKALQRVVKAAQRSVGVSLPTTTDIYTSRCRKRATCIMKDPTHPAHSLFVPLPSGRRLREEEVSAADKMMTHDCAAMHSSNHIIKFADDTTVVGLMSKNDESAYREEVQRLTDWCRTNNLSLNVDKTKEMVVDFRRTRRDHSPLHIDGSTVEIVKSTKFLGVHLAEDLTWSLNTSTITKKAQQRLYLLRRLRKAHLPPPILTTFYRGTIESILSSCITAWFGNCTASDRKSLQRIVRTAEKIIGVSLPTIMDIYTTHCIRKTTSIVDDHTHPSHTLFTLLPSEK